MAFDGIFMKALRCELEKELKEARISKIQQPEKEELLITFKNPAGQKRLLISANASLPFLYFTEENKPSPLTAPNFCMLLRKHIGSGRVVNVSQPGLERIIDITFEHLDELGDVKQKHLITEVMGKYSNIIFTDDKYMILDSIRHVPPTVSSVRTVLPGREYFIPETQGKRDLLTETEEGFLNNLKPTDTCLSALCDRYTGLSRPTVSEFFFAWGQDPDTFVSALTEAQKTAFLSVVMTLKEKVQRDAFEPETAYKEKAPEAFSALPLSSYRTDTAHYSIVSFASPSALLYTYYRDRNLATNMKQRSYDTRKAAQTLLERAVKKLDLQEKQIRDAEKRETYRLYGELLTAYSYSLPVGEKTVTVMDYLNNDRELQIPVDPDLSIADNAKKYYERYNKLKRTYEALSVQTEETRAQIEHLSSIIQAIDMAEDPEVLKQIREEMADAGFLKRSASNGKKIEKIHSQPYHYISSDGYDIYVGKNNLQNDWLTFKFANDHDIWMHAKKAPGSHVIIRTLGEEIPDRTYEEGAALAAYYSANRNAGKVEVDYAEKKHIKKPNASRPGFVVYYTNYSLMAEPDISGLRTEDQ